MHPQIQTVRRLFEEGREDPPLNRNQPPVAGAIRWCRSLLGRVRRTWVRLQGLSSKLEGLDAGRRAAAAMTGEHPTAGMDCYPAAVHHATTLLAVC